MLNGDNAAQLKNEWTVLAGQKNLEDEFLEVFIHTGGGNLKYFQDSLDEVAKDADYDEILQLYGKCREKVCEMSACRALTKKLKEGETRKSAILKNKAMVRELGGTLPPRLGLLVAAAEAAG